MLGQCSFYTTKGDEIHLTISDNGIGIPDNIKPHIFEKFQRGTNTSGIKGTGLGLAIVKAAIEEHNGTIQVESNVGKGTIFHITLPIRGH